MAKLPQVSPVQPDALIVRVVDGAIAVTTLTDAVRLSPDAARETARRLCEAAAQIESIDYTVRLGGL